VPASVASPSHASFTSTASRVTIYEAEPSAQARTQGGQLDIHEHNGQPALEAAGLTDEFRAIIREGGEASRVLDPQAKVLLDEPDEGTGGRPEVPRGGLRRILLDSLSPQTIQWGKKLTGVAALGDGRHELTFADGSTASTGFLVGADGVVRSNLPVSPRLAASRLSNRAFVRPLRSASALAAVSPGVGEVEPGEPRPRERLGHQVAGMARTASDVRDLDTLLEPVNQPRNQRQRHIDQGRIVHGAAVFGHESLETSGRPGTVPRRHGGSSPRSDLPPAPAGPDTGSLSSDCLFRQPGSARRRARRAAKKCPSRHL
jgi:hypothetical protein